MSARAAIQQPLRLATRCGPGHTELDLVTAWPHTSPSRLTAPRVRRPHGAGCCAGGFHEQAQLHKTLSHLKPVFRSVPHVPRDAVKVLGTIAEGSFGEVSLAKTQQFGELAIKWLKVGSCCGAERTG